MIITDYNEMSIDELKAISKILRKEYIIEGGRITEVVNANERKN